MHPWARCLLERSRRHAQDLPRVPRARPGFLGGRGLWRLTTSGAGHRHRGARAAARPAALVERWIRETWTAGLRRPGHAERRRSRATRRAHRGLRQRRNALAREARRRRRIHARAARRDGKGQSGAAREAALRGGARSRRSDAARGRPGRGPPDHHGDAHRNDRRRLSRAGAAVPGHRAAPAVQGAVHVAHVPADAGAPAAAPRERLHDVHLLRR